MESQQTELKRVEGAAACIPADCSHDEWLRVLMAIKSKFDEAGRDLAESWSERGDSYNKKDFNDTWKSISPNGGVNIGTLIRMARKNGWTDDSERKPTPSTPEEIAQREAMRKAAEDERKAKREKAAIEAATIWNEAPPALADHPYLKRKGTQPHGARIYHGNKNINSTPCNGALLLPMYLNGKISGLQFIPGEGEKRFIPGAEKGGYPIGKTEPGKPVCICEGFATGATIHEATGYPVIVAFDAGNLCKMALAFRAKNPDSMIILCADDDVSKTGQRKAEEAARAVGGLLALPEFGESRPDGATDFNDMAKHCGPEAVKRVIDAAMPVNQNSDPVGSVLSRLKSPDDTNTAATTGGGLAGASGAEIIAKLAAMHPLDYERKREELAKELGVRVSVLDKQVKAEQSKKAEPSRLPFKEVEPCPDPVDPAQLLDEVESTIRRFIILTDEQATAAALWVTMAWFIAVVRVAALALITAPEKGCGKSQMLDVFGRLSPRPINAASCSTAFLFRVIELYSPTLLIDEIDTFIKQNDEIKGMINAGHTRAQAFVGRVVGEKHEPQLFNLWAAKALAGIDAEKHLPDATMSRAVVFNVRRKLKTESVEILRHDDDEQDKLFNDLTAKLARFALDYSDHVRKARPVLPDKLSSRDQDNWSSLLAIASIAGNEWLEKATAAALALSKVEDKPVSTGNELLDDIRQIFEKKKVKRISTANLIEALCEDDEAPWSTYSYGKPISPRGVAKQLKAYGIAPVQMRMNSYENPVRGFELSQFNEAFERYLTVPDDDPIPSLSPPGNHPLHVTKRIKDNDINCLSVTNEKSRNVTEILPVTEEPNNHGACNAVTDKTDIFRGVDEGVPL